MSMYSLNKMHKFLIEEEAVHFIEYKFHKIASYNILLLTLLEKIACD